MREVKGYESDSGLTAVVSHEPDTGWMLTVARPDRYPTNEELQGALDRHLPDGIRMTLVQRQVSDRVPQLDAKTGALASVKGTAYVVVFVENRS